MLNGVKVTPDDAGNPDALVVPGPRGGQGPDYDARLTPGDFASHTYCAAPRDLLNQPLSWPADADRCSDPVTVAAQDFDPPAMPVDVRAVAERDTSRVAIRWGHPAPAGVHRFSLERTFDMHCEAGPCWTEVATVAGNATSWTDNASPCANRPDQHPGCWYRVVARDAAGNRSAPSQAVYARNEVIELPSMFDINQFDCDGRGGDDSACVDIDAEPEPASVRVNCRLSPGGDELFIAEVGPEALDDLNLADLIRTVYSPPLRLEGVACRVIFADIYGNLSDLDDSPVFTFDMASEDPDQLAQPIITGIETSFVSPSWHATVQWDMAAHPMLDRFELVRVRLSDDSQQTFNIADEARRSYTDTTVELGERYRYTVRALPGSPEINTTESEPREHTILPGEERPLAQLSWSATSPQRDAASATTSMVVSLAGLGPERPVAYAVYRSLSANRDFIQITPVLQTTEGFISYSDNQSQRGCMYYTVVTFDTRTGEPTGYAAPRQPGLCLTGEQTVYTPTTDVPPPAPPAPLCAPAQHSLDPGLPFRFGGGFQVLVEGLSDDFTGPARVDGAGFLQLVTTQQTFSVPMSFSRLTVDAAGRVCSGSVSVDLSSLPGGGLLLQAPGGWRYRLRSIELRPWFSATNVALATLDLYSGAAFTNFDSINSNATRIELSGAQLTSSLGFDYQENFARRAGHSCTNPEVAFRLETLPLDVIPTGTATIDENGITLNTACAQYVDRFNPVGSTMVTLPNMGPGPHRALNDGYLNGMMTGSGISITPAGLDGSFSGTGPRVWHTAYPFGARVELSNGLSVTIADGQIVGGSTSAGTVGMSYHQTTAGGSPAGVTSSFTSLTIGERGDLTGAVSLGTIRWDAFSAPALPNGSWTLYTGAITTPDRPASHEGGVARSVMWRPSPVGATPVPIPGGALPGLLEPGLNRRLAGATMDWNNCGSSARFSNVAMDAYLRLGGLTQRTIPLFAPGSSMTIHGYTFIPTRFDMQFLDSALLERDLSGVLDLPFPSNIEVPLTEIWLTGDIDNPAAGEAACLGGGSIPADAQQQTFDYWEAQARLSSAEFRQAPAPTAVWFLGELTNIPHLAVGNGAAELPAELAVQPDGNFRAVAMAYDRPDYRFQGFPYLLERLRLSDWLGNGRGEAPAWEVSATTLPSAPPAATWSTSGFVGLNGVAVAPYFGPIAVAPGPAGDTHAVMPWAPNLTGFAGRPGVSKEWVKLRRVNITFDYDRLVHTYDPATRRGRYVGFKGYSFVPDSLALPIPAGLGAIPDPLRMIQLDTGVVIEPDTTGVYLGLSSGVAAFRALMPNAAAAVPDAATLNLWASRMGINGTATPVYRNQLALAWAQRAGFAYAETTDVLDDLSDENVQNLIDEEYVGGRTGGLLAARGVNIRRLRGLVEMEGEGLEAQFRRFQLSTQVEIRGRDQAATGWVPIPENPALEPEPPLFYAERMTLSIERHGDFTLVGKNVRSSQFGDELESFDAALVINTTKPQFEGGLTLYGLKAGGVKIDNASAVLGIGAEVNYLGMSFDGRFGVGGAEGAGESALGGEIDVGGDLLAGKVDPSSLVLQTNFADAMAQINGDLNGAFSDEQLGAMAGFYVRAYAGGIPIIGNGCTLSLQGDAELAFWYWQTQQGENIGGRLKPAVYGEVLCLVKARGALSLEYQSVNGQDHFIGEGYLAGGVGFCEPESWGDWGERWWGDSACYQAGAGLNATYHSGAGWSVDYGVDAEGL